MSCRRLSLFLRLDMRKRASLIGVSKFFALLSAVIVLFSCAADRELVISPPAPPPGDSARDGGTGARNACA